MFVAGGTGFGELYGTLGAESELAGDEVVAVRTVMEVLSFVFTFSFLKIPFFVELFEEGGSWSDEEVDRETEDWREEEDQEDGEGLDEDIGRAIGDIFDNPDDECCPDDEKIPEDDLETEIDRHIAGDKGEYLAKKLLQRGEE